MSKKKGDDGAKKKAKGQKDKSGITIKVEACGDGKKHKKDKAKHNHEGFEKLSKLAEHPLVADLLAVGAMAAVAAFAESGVAARNGAKGEGTSNGKAAVKAAGKAAAAAIGQRLMNEFGDSLKKSQAK